MKGCIVNGKLVDWPNGTAVRLANELRALGLKGTHIQELEAARRIQSVLKGIINSNDANNCR